MSKKTKNVVPKTFKDFMSWYKSKMPDEVYLVKNEEHYEEIFNCIDLLTEAISKNSPDAQIEVDFGKLDPSAIYFKAVANELMSKDLATLSAVLSKADNIEVYPIAVAKGEEPKLCMSILFNGAYDSAPPQNSPFPEAEKGYGKPIIRRKTK